MRHFTVRLLGPVVTSLLLAGCAPLQDSIPILALLKSAPKPPALAVQAVYIPSLPRYRPVSYCQYTGQMSDGVTRQRDSETIVVRRVRDRLLVTSTIGGEQSTLLISPSGQKYDYNAADASGRRLTPDEFSRVQGERGPAMNNIDLYIPSFRPGPANPGDVVARLRDSSGIVQAVFVYKGLTSFKGRDAVLLDLAMATPDGAAGRGVGFSIIDAQRALPLLFAASGRPSIRVEQIECRD